MGKPGILNAVLPELDTQTVSFSCLYCGESVSVVYDQQSGFNRDTVCGCGVKYIARKVKVLEADRWQLLIDPESVG